MATIDGLPTDATIIALRGTLDYYNHRGSLSVRKWPVTPKAHLTAATLAQSAAYSEWLRNFAATAPEIQQAARDQVNDVAWTHRDLICFALAGNLYNP